MGAFAVMLALVFLVRMLATPEDQQGLRLIYGGAFLVSGGVFYACGERNNTLCNRRDEGRKHRQESETVHDLKP